MAFGLEVRNDSGNLLINQSFANLYLSRKVKASTLPIVTINGSNTWVMGSFQARQIGWNQGEVLAACGRAKGERFNPYAITYGLSGIGGSAATPQPYLFAMQSFFFGTGKTAWMDWGYEYTGVNNVNTLPDDLYVYVFSQAKRQELNDAYGLQVFNENGIALYDSRTKSARVLYSGNMGYEIPSDKKVAIAPIGVTISADGFQGNIPASYLYGIGSHYSSDFGRIETVAGAARCQITGGLYSYRMTEEDPHIGHVVLDVTGF